MVSILKLIKHSPTVALAVWLVYNLFGWTTCAIAKVKQHREEQEQVEQQACDEEQWTHEAKLMDLQCQIHNACVEVQE